MKSVLKCNLNPKNHNISMKFSSFSLFNLINMNNNNIKKIFYQDLLTIKNTQKVV